MYYAVYQGSDTTLAFKTAVERDLFVTEESTVHPNCCAVSADMIQTKGKQFIYDASFGCLVLI